MTSPRTVGIMLQFNELQGTITFILICTTAASASVCEGGSVITLYYIWLTFIFNMYR